MENRAKWMMLALALTGAAGVGYAQTGPQTGDTSASPAAGAQTPGAGHWHHHRGMLGGGLMLHTLHQLNLTDGQQQSIKQILTTAHTQFETQRQGAAASNFVALSNPGDPNHAAALQDQQTRLTARLQAREQVEQQIYAVLNAEQKAQFASILAARQAKMAQHGAS